MSAKTKPVKQRQFKQSKTKQSKTSRKSELKSKLKQKLKQQSKPKATKSKIKPKASLHPNNPHQGRYDLPLLCKALPELSAHICQNPLGENTIDFSNPMAVKVLNKALLFHHYKLKYWDIPAGFLCPPIPSRADYIHHIAQLLNPDNSNNNPQKTHNPQGIRALDIGTGANLIYPIIGVQAYGWRFTATDIDPVAVENAKFICQQNSSLKHKIRVQQQKNPQHIFQGIIKANDWFDVTICNPPFHSSMDEAMASNQRKQKNLADNKSKRGLQAGHGKLTNHTTKDNSAKSNTINLLNFGGQKAELWCEGGEIAFLKRMAKESQQFAGNVGCFTTLVSKAENVKPLTDLLNKLGVTRLTEIPMQHGQKTTRVLAWGWD